jgi:hypothetical protein
MAETGIVAGLLAAPLLGEVTKEDADSAVIVDVARDILGDPYADDATAEDVTKDDPASDKTSLDKSAPDSTTPDSTTPDKTTPDSTASDDVPEPASKPGDERPTPPEGTGTIASAGQSGGASKAPSGRTDDA